MGVAKVSKDLVRQSLRALARLDARRGLAKSEEDLEFADRLRAVRESDTIGIGPLTIGTRPREAIPFPLYAPLACSRPLPAAWQASRSLSRSERSRDDVVAAEIDASFCSAWARMSRAIVGSECRECQTNAGSRVSQILGSPCEMTMDFRSLQAGPTRAA